MIDEDSKRMHRVMESNTAQIVKAINKLTDVIKFRDIKKENNDNYWHCVDKNNEGAPDEKYGWVLVKIRDDEVDFEYNTPHIAGFKNGKWMTQEHDLIYGTPEFPFTVVAWRPLPYDIRR